MGPRPSRGPIARRAGWSRPRNHGGIFDQALSTARPAPDEATGRIAAAVDIGSNSVHLLVGEVTDHTVTAIIDQAVFLRLGSASDAARLGSAHRAGLVETLVGYARLARRFGAGTVTFVATEPLRRAADAAVIVSAAGRASGVPLHVLGHDEEALLTLIGVTSGLPADHDLGVIDVGGGSSELVFVGPDRRARAIGIRAGSARLTDRFVVADPPTSEEVQALRLAARGLLAAAPDEPLEEMIAVGGTASNILKVIGVGPEDPWLDRGRLDAALAALLSEPSGSAAERHLLNPVRARVLPAGIAIVGALLERYGLERLTVSDAGIREGTILATLQAGVCWRDQLEQLAHGWVR